MKLVKLTVNALEMMKPGNAKVFEYGNYREYETAKTICSKYGRIFNRRFSCTDNHNNTFTVICKERSQL